MHDGTSFLVELNSIPFNVVQYKSTLFNDIHLDLNWFNQIQHDSSRGNFLQPDSILAIVVAQIKNPISLMLLDLTSYFIELD